MVSTVQEIDSHPFGVSSLAVQDQLLVSCGFTMRQGVKVAENTLRVYDLRTLKMVIPVTVPLGAHNVKFNHSESDRTIFALCPLRYQIATANIDVVPPVRDSIHVLLIYTDI